MSEKLEKFTEADVRSGEAIIKADEGYFKDDGFVSNMNREKCTCRTRAEHEYHLRNNIFGV
jgi:hypothetical protein